MEAPPKTTTLVALPRLLAPPETAILPALILPALIVVVPV